MPPRIAVLFSIPPIVAVTLGLGYAVWLSRTAEEALPDPDHLPITCERSKGGPSTILAGPTAEEVLRWRCQPGHSTTLASWVPGEDEVARLEARLPAFWLSQESRAKPLESYIRQYAGFMVDGHKSICVNLVATVTLSLDVYAYGHDPDLRARLPKGVCPEDFWRHEPIAYVTDGGFDYCGVTFDVASGQFSDPNCNGLRVRSPRSVTHNSRLHLTAGGGLATNWRPRSDAAA